MNDKIDKLFRAIEENKVISAVQNGLVLAIPVLMVGSVTLMIKSIPIEEYQIFLKSFMGGTIFELLRIINSSTMGIISLILLLTISYSYEKIELSQHNGLLSIISLCSYIAFSMGSNVELTISIFEGIWLSNAIFIALTSSALFIWVSRYFTMRFKSYSDGADSEFNTMIASIVPAAIAILFFPVLNMVMKNIFGVVDFQLFASGVLFDVFSKIGNNIFSAVLLVFLIHIMWFFGIHGSMVLDGVAKQLFNPGIQVNFELILSGREPVEIFTKTFFDTFVLFGGCGTTLCLVAAMLIWEKRNNFRQLSKLAIMPALFNINEIIVFGIPIVLNPILFIPFICTPLLLTVLSWALTLLGIVPYTMNMVEWTTPIFLSGYAATGSIRGSLLQLLNMVIGILIYMPFVKMSQKMYERTIVKQIDELKVIVEECEEKGERPVLLYRKDKLKSVSKMLASDMQRDIKENKINLFYQPQLNYEGKIIGAEALLRWKHNIGGYIYPPLAIAIADEGGFLDELGMNIINTVAMDTGAIISNTGIDICVSFNIASTQLENHKIIGFIQNCIKKYNLNGKSFGLEITEQTVLSSSHVIEERIMAIKNMGVQIIMDDFGMGHSSLKYLQNNKFDLIKLDGSLVTHLMTNKRCSDIISSIVYLSQSLNIDILAEYVETEEQKEILNNLGCSNYQGYLYSAAIPFDEFIEFIFANK